MVKSGGERCIDRFLSITYLPGSIIIIQIVYLGEGKLCFRGDVYTFERNLYTLCIHGDPYVMGNISQAIVVDLKGNKKVQTVVQFYTENHEIYFLGFL